MNDTTKKIIYYHVGTGKTGTTFLQYRVFPKLKHIYYIQRTKYKKAKKIINNSSYAKYLVSQEFDQQLEREVKIFSSSFPNAIPIIVFRRHDGYIASQYRRFVKNGFKGSFVDFFDLKHDKGRFKKRDLDYFGQIGILEKYFTKKPIVLFYEDLQNDPIAFIEKLAHHLDVSINLQSINLKKKHTSYSEKQLKAILFIGKYINIKKRRIFKNKALHYLWKLCFGTILYPTLFLAKAVPTSFFDPKPLIPNRNLEEIRLFYKRDWEKCHAYSEGQQLSTAALLPRG